MNSRSSLWLVLVALGLFAYIFFFEWRAPAPDQSAGQVTKLFPDFNPAKVSSVEIIRSNKNIIRTERTNDQWRLTRPLLYPAQPTAIENWLELFTVLNRRYWISAQDLLTQPGGLATFGLDEPRATVIIQHGDKRIQLRLGDKTPVGEKLYLQIVGSDGVYVTESLLTDHLPESSVDWRDPVFLNLAGLKFDRFQVQAGGGREFVLQRDPTDRLWRLTIPRPARANNGRISQLLQQLQTVRISQFVSDVAAADLEPYGLHSPELMVTFAQGTNNLLIVKFGKPLTNNTAFVFARRSTYPNIVAVPRQIAYALRVPYTEFLDPHLIEFAVEAVSRIEVRADEAFVLQKQTNGSWRVVEPLNFPADPALVQGFLKQLNSLRIVDLEKEVVTDLDLPNYGLLPPARQYILKADDPAGGTNHLVAQIDFGTNQTDKIFVRRTDESPVYKVSLEEARALPRAAFELRDRRIWNFATNQVNSLSITLKDQTFKLVRNADGKWIVAAPSQGMVNPFALEEALYRLGQLWAKAWEAQGDKNLSRYGFAETAHKLSIEVTNSDKSEVLTVEFGSTSTSGGPYALIQLQGQKTVFEFPAEIYLVYHEVVRNLMPTTGSTR